jgi:hypothetical protein
MFNETTVYADASRMTSQEITIIAFVVAILGCIMLSALCTCDHKPDEEEDNDIVVFSLQS